MIKKSVVIKAKRIKPLKWDYETIILFTLFLCGVILGVMLIKNCSEEFCDFLKSGLGNYISTKNKSSFITCLSGTTAFLLLFVLIDFLFGLCAVGTPLVWIVPVAFGVICGCSASGLFKFYGLKGLFYCVLVELVCYAITAATLVKCCCESTQMSLELFSCIIGNKNNYKNSYIFKEYALNYLVLCIPVIVGAVVSTVSFKVFASLFIFT